MMTKEGCVDFYWAKPKSEFNPRTVYVYVEGEYGFIPLITFNSIIGDTPSYCELLSLNQSVEPFNRMPNENNPAWHLYQVTRNEVVLSITNWWPFLLEEGGNPTMWHYIYPMVRDVIIALKEMGCESLVFFTSMNNLTPDDDPKIMVYDLHNNFHPEEEFMLAPPAWLFPFLSHRHSIKSSVVSVTQDEGYFVDSKALSLTKEYFTALGLPYDETKAENTIQNVRNMEGQLSEQRYGFSLEINDDDETEGWE